MSKTASLDLRSQPSIAHLDCDDARSVYDCVNADRGRTLDLSCAVPVLLLLGTEGQVNMQLLAIMMVRTACAEKVAAAVAVVIVVTVVDVVAAGRRSCGGSGRKGSHGGSVRGRNPLSSSCYS